MWVHLDDELSVLSPSFSSSSHLLKNCRYKLVDCDVPEIITVKNKIMEFCLNLSATVHKSNLRVQESKSGTRAGATICVYYTAVFRAAYYCKSLFLIPPFILLPLTHVVSHHPAAAVLGLPCINIS